MPKRSLFPALIVALVAACMAPALPPDPEMVTFRTGQGHTVPFPLSQVVEAQPASDDGSRAAPTPRPRQGIPCPQCSTPIPVAMADLIMKRYLDCKACGLKLEIDGNQAAALSQWQMGNHLRELPGQRR